MLCSGKLGDLGLGNRSNSGLQSSISLRTNLTALGTDRSVGQRADIRHPQLHNYWNGAFLPSDPLQPGKLARAKTIHRLRVINGLRSVGSVLLFLRTDRRNNEQHEGKRNTGKHS